MWGQLAVRSNGELDAGRLPGLRTLPWAVSSMEITGGGSGFGGSIHTFSLVFLVWVGAVSWVGL